MTATLQYRMYIDEVGNATGTNLSAASNWLLGLTGVIIEKAQNNIIDSEMSSLKLNHFGIDGFSLHRTEVESKYPGQPPEIRRLRYSNIRANFYRDLLALLNSWDYTIVTVVLDKRSLYSIYPAAVAYEPYTYCVRFLLERFVRFLNERAAQGEVICEQRIRGIRSWQNPTTADFRVAAEYRTFKSGMQFPEYATFRYPPPSPAEISATLPKPEMGFRRKVDNVPGLQIADFVGYPSYFEALQAEGNGAYPLPNLKPLSISIVPLLASKYRRSSRGKIEGYGRRLLVIKQK